MNSLLFPDITFSARVDTFWTNFKELEKPIRESFDTPASGIPSVNEKVSALLDDLFQDETSFSIYKNPGDQTINLDISPQGSDVIKILGKHVVDRAPRLKGWSFALYHRPRSVANIFNANDAEFGILSISFCPSFNDKKEKINVVLCGDIFKWKEESQKFNIAFLLLDRLMGEKRVEDRVSGISFSCSSIPGSIPILSIKQFINEIEQSRGWKTVTDKTGFVYKLATQEPIGDAPVFRSRRDDIIAGSTSYPRIVFDYLDCKHEMTEKMIGTGADFVYATVLNSEKRQPSKDDEGESSVIFDVYDDLNDIGTVTVIGNAIGVTQTHIDLAIFDGERSLASVDAILKKKLLVKRVTFGFFRAALGSKFVEIENGKTIIRDETW